MKRIIEVVCVGILGVGVFFPTSAKAFVSTLTNINNQAYAMTHSDSETLLARRCDTYEGSDQIPDLNHSSIIQQNSESSSGD